MMDNQFNPSSAGYNNMTPSYPVQFGAPGGAISPLNQFPPMVGGGMF